MAQVWGTHWGSPVKIKPVKFMKPAVWFPAVRCGSGTDVFTERLCQALNARGIRAEITWLPHRAEYAPWSVKAPKAPFWANVVHINSWLPRRFSPANLPLVVTLHSCVHDPALTPYKSYLQALYHRHWIMPIERANMARASCLVAVSHYTARQAERAFGVRNIEVIYNGIDRKCFRPVPRERPNRPFRLLYVGNWTKRKGVDLLAPILERLGDGFVLYYTADRQGRDRGYRLPPNCLCLGRLSGNELVRAYQEADALLFPSRLEGLPLTVMEAMACGLAVIAAACSSLPEVVQDGASGMLCPRDDVDAFAAACQRLAQDVVVWKRLRVGAGAQAARLAFDAMVDAYVDIYGAVLRQPCARGSSQR